MIRAGLLGHRVNYKLAIEMIPFVKDTQFRAVCHLILKNLNPMQRASQSARLHTPQWQARSAARDLPWQKWTPHELWRLGV